MATSISDNALTTLQRTKDYLSITVDTFDLVLERLINGAAKMTEQITKRKLKYDESDGLTQGVYTPATTPQDSLLNGNGTPELWLPQFPVIEITLVRSRDTPSSSWVTIDSDNYLNRPETGQLSLSNATLPTTGVWPKGVQTVEVTYKAGFDFASEDLPFNVEQFQWLFVHYYFSQRKRDPGMQSETLTGVYSYNRKRLDPVWGIPRDIVVLVEGYRKLLI